MKHQISGTVILTVLVSSVRADDYVEIDQTGVVKPDGRTVIARLYRSEPTRLWSAPIFIAEIDGIKEIVVQGGFGHGLGARLQSPDKREFVQMASFEGGVHGGAVFDLVTGKSRQLSDSTWKEDLLKLGYTELRPRSTTQPATQADRGR